MRYVIKKKQFYDSFLSDFYMCLLFFFSFKSPPKCTADKPTQNVSIMEEEGQEDLKSHHILFNHKDRMHHFSVSTQDGKATIFIAC